MIERREICKEHAEMIKENREMIKGNGRKGLEARVIKLEVMIWVVIALLVGNGGLIAYTLKLIK